MRRRPHENNERLRDADLLRAQSQILSAIAADRPLSDTLNLIAETKDVVLHDERCAICLIDADRVTLLDGASPSLPRELSARLHHLRLSDRTGGSRDGVDPLTHPAWAPYRAEIGHHGLTLVRSDAVVAANGEVVGYLLGLATDPTASHGERAQRWVALFADLTRVALRHAQVDADLQLSERRLAAVIDHSPAVIALKDLQGRYLMINRAMEEFFERRREDIIGRDDSLFGAALEEKVTQLQRETMESGDPAEGELEIAARWLRVICFPVTNARGMPYAIGEIGLDITDEKRNEERLYQVARLESAGRVASEIAHDFNNILNGIGISAAVAEDPEAGAAEVRAAMANIGSFVSRASALTERLLGFARPRSSNPEVVDVNEVVASLSPLLDATVRKKTTVQIDLAAGLPSIRVDKIALERALVNLVANARDAIAEGGRVVVGTRLVDTGAPEIDVWVQDDGQGMDPAIVDRVFEPFFTTKPQEEGSGLGLATVQAVAVDAGGRVSIDSKPGAGTEVHLYLPVAR